MRGTANRREKPRKEEEMQQIEVPTDSGLPPAKSV